MYKRLVQLIPGPEIPEDRRTVALPKNRDTDNIIMIC
jgi:hypothetical protein